METDKKARQKKSELRRQAEKQIDKSGNPLQGITSKADQIKLIHELQVHQVELELQNQELERTRRELEQSLNRYTDLYDFAPVGYLSLDAEGIILAINLAGAALLSKERGQLENCRLVNFISAADRPVFERFLEQAFATSNRETCEVTLQKAGDVTRCVQLEAIHLESEEICRLAMIDITELKMARLEGLKVQKLESLGVLAGGIAHDFNNLLMGIAGNIALARIQKHDPECLGRYLADAEKAVDKAKGLARQLLTFAKGGEPIRKPVKLDVLLREALNLVNSGTSVSCKIDVNEDLWPVAGDENQLNQVFYHLILNAVQASPSGGSVRITAENVVARSTNAKRVKVAIADSGTGIPEDIQQNIFDPYFTTKRQGSGMGLAICDSVIKKHLGKISIEASSSLGTTMTVDLPAVEHFESREIDQADAVVPGSGRILIMDDEPMIRQLAVGLVEALGYVGECTADGREAIELYRTRKAEGTPFDAVIFDLTVAGGMGGKEALDILREFDPGIKAIVSSGYATNPILANHLSHGFQGVLCKPYQFEELSQVLSDLVRADSHQ